VTGGVSGAFARKIQSEIDCLRSANMMRSLGLPRSSAFICVYLRIPS
jgi:hypothetical protein